MIEHLLGAKLVSVLADVLFVLFCQAILWAMIKSSYQRVTGQPVPRKWYTLALDIMADLAINLPGALNRAQPGLFWEPGRKPERIQGVSETPKGESEEL